MGNSDPVGGEHNVAAVARLGAGIDSLRRLGRDPTGRTAPNSRTSTAGPGAELQAFRPEYVRFERPPVVEPAGDITLQPENRHRPG